MDQALVQALRARNVDVITALDAGMIDREDAEHLDYATEHGRVLCTFNISDFYRLHSEYVAQSKPHAGIILMRQQYYSVGEQMRRLLRLMASKSADEMKNWVEFLSAWD
jgi:predicted nuclease of predicted toxin-antitoxin system